MTTMQAPVPLHPPPLQPVKVDPPVGAASSTTLLAVKNSAEQTAPQEIPLGLLVTVPKPFPALTTLNLLAAAATMKRAVTVELLVTAQGPVPEQAPLQPANVEPGAAAAFKDTVTPS